jgi:hypothetical protein
VFGLERSLLASGNPMSIGEINTKDVGMYYASTEENEKHVTRGKKLGSAKQGSGHDNFLSGIDVYYDVKYSAYWSMEFQRYHFNQIISSQSKMHRLVSMGLKDNFSSMFNKYVDKDIIDKIKAMVMAYKMLDVVRAPTPEAEKELSKTKYEAFMTIVSNLPMGFEMWMTIKTNYLQLKTMYNQRKGHKLQEDWGAFCAWCLTLPNFKELTGIE